MVEIWATQQLCKAIMSLSTEWIFWTSSFSGQEKLTVTAAGLHSYSSTAFPAVRVEWGVAGAYPNCRSLKMGHIERQTAICTRGDSLLTHCQWRGFHLSRMQICFFGRWEEVWAPDANSAEKGPRPRDWAGNPGSLRVFSHEKIGNLMVKTNICVLMTNITAHSNLPIPVSHFTEKLKVRPDGNWTVIDMVFKRTFEDIVSSLKGPHYENSL